MKNGLKILAIIGARSGSKGVLHKNIRPLAGKPLIAWAIEAALKSRRVNRVIVSTDSQDYAAIAKKFGAEVPHLRPAELAADMSPEFDYIKYVLEWLKENENYVPDIVVRMHPTVPLQQPEDIDSCIEELLKDPEAHSAVVIAEARQHPHKALKLVEDGRGGKRLVTYVTGSGREVTPIARQNYEKAYFRANLIASKITTIKELDSLTGDRVRYHIIPQERAVDIDSPTDFLTVENLLKHLKLEVPISESVSQATVVRSKEIEKTLKQAPGTGKNLLEPLNTIASEKGLPFKILEDNDIFNPAELHRDSGDLWLCLEGEVTFVYGGELVNPQEKKNADGTINQNELKAKEIRGGETTVLNPGDWFWIPAGVSHQHFSKSVARMMIIKIPRSS